MVFFKKVIFASLRETGYAQEGRGRGGNVLRDWNYT